MLRRVLLALGAVALLGLTLALPARLPDADTQSGAAPAYEIEVLPGVAHSDPVNEKRWSIDAAGNSTMTAAGSSSRRRRNIRRPVPLATAKAPTACVDAIGARGDDDRAH